MSNLTGLYISTIPAEYYPPYPFTISLAIAITRNSRKTRNSFSGESEFRVIIFGPIHKKQ